LAAPVAKNFNTTLVARLSIPGFLAIFLVAELPQKKNVFVHKNPLASFQLVLSQRRATGLDVSFVTKQSEFLVCVALFY